MQVISSIRNHILYPHKLIVIDNGSIDGSVEYLKFLEEKRIIDNLILNKENLGISEAKNQGLKIVKDLAKTQEIKYVCITDNDIVPPFIRENGCVLEHIVKLMEEHKFIGMCGVDLNKENAPDNQEWWWRLRQHSMKYPEFAEISIGFWFSVIRYEYFNEFEFVGESSYGRVDESLRNWISINKKHKIGLLKGVYNSDKNETIPKLGIHLGWTEDMQENYDYVLFKKQERFKAEKAWKEKNRQW